MTKSFKPLLKDLDNINRELQKVVSSLEKNRAMYGSGLFDAIRGDEFSLIEIENKSLKEQMTAYRSLLQDISKSIQDLLNELS